MQLHQLQPKIRKKEKKRVGRGGKKGTYSGRGIKGQKARAGRKLQPIIREVLKRYHKLRGYRFKKMKKRLVWVNVGVLDKNFKEGERVCPKILLEKKLIRKIDGRIPKVKILGKGKITKALTIEGCDISKTAREAIEKAGGTVK